MQTLTFSAKFVSLKQAVEEVVTIRYYLRSMGFKNCKPSVIYSGIIKAIYNAVDPIRPLRKQYLALANHFCCIDFVAIDVINVVFDIVIVTVIFVVLVIEVVVVVVVVVIVIILLFLLC